MLVLFLSFHFIAHNAIKTANACELLIENVLYSSKYNIQPQLAYKEDPISHFTTALDRQTHLVICGCWICWHGEGFFLDYLCVFKRISERKTLASLYHRPIMIHQQQQTLCKPQYNIFQGLFKGCVPTTAPVHHHGGLWVSEKVKKFMYVVTFSQLLRIPLPLTFPFYGYRNPNACAITFTICLNQNIKCNLMGTIKLSRISFWCWYDSRSNLSPSKLPHSSSPSLILTLNTEWMWFVIRLGGNRGSLLKPHLFSWRVNLMNGIRWCLMLTELSGGKNRRRVGGWVRVLVCGYVSVFFAGKVSRAQHFVAPHQTWRCVLWVAATRFMI